MPDADTSPRKTYVRPIDFKHGRVDLSHGSGGRAMAQLIDELFLRAFDNDWLRQRNDQAAFTVPAGRMVMATDSHVVSPLFFPGGDLDLLNGPEGHPDQVVTLPIHGDKKEEVGANVWLYWGGLSFFGQYVDQEMAGLPRTGLEGELSWRFDLPLWIAVGERQLFPWIAPAVRWSELDNDFRNARDTPAPSLAWDWKKVDAGVRLGIFDGIDVTMEYADNQFITARGRRDNNELLATLRWRS